VGFKIDHLGWIEPLKSHAKRVGKPCVFIPHISGPDLEGPDDGGPYDAWATKVIALLGQEFFMESSGCLVFDDLDEAIRWTNAHDEKDWHFFAVCIDGEGEPRTENT
jgi:hypothetical protein